MRLQPLPENVGTARRVSEVVRQRVPGHRTGDGERPTAECVALVPGEEVKARYVQWRGTGACPLIHPNYFSVYLGLGLGLGLGLIQ